MSVGSDALTDARNASRVSSVLPQAKSAKQQASARIKQIIFFILIPFAFLLGFRKKIY
jgi:hypothetical protein